MSLGSIYIYIHEWRLRRPASKLLFKSTKQYGKRNKSMVEGKLEQGRPRRGITK